MREFNLRPVNAGDIAPMCRIISAIGLTELKDVLQSKEVTAAIAAAKDPETGAINLRSVGGVVLLNVADIVIRSIPRVENDIFKFMGSLSGMTVDGIRSLKLSDFRDLIMQIIHMDEFEDFTQAVLEYTKPE